MKLARWLLPALSLLAVLWLTWRDVRGARTGPGPLHSAHAAVAALAGGADCASCHAPPFYLDHLMHDLHVERFLKGESADGPIKTFTLRGIKESPPYLHDGRCFTLEDTVEFFNIVLQLKLAPQEKQDLVAFMRQL